MRRTTISLTLLVSLTILAFVVSPAMATKPQEVIAGSNGYPGGFHSKVNLQQDVSDNGSKLLQTKSYPVATTEDRAPGHIMVDKVTDPRYDPQVFDFTLTGGPDNIFRSFQLQDHSDFAPYDSGHVKSGSYTVTETEAFGWHLTDIILVDPDGESHCNAGTTSATIDLDPGEEVLVIFKNAKQ